MIIKTAFRAILQDTFFILIELESIENSMTGTNFIHYYPNDKLAIFTSLYL